MRYAFLFLAALLAPASAVAQAPVCSEQKIQLAVQKMSMKNSDDSFFWSGAFDKPLIGKAEQQAARTKAETDEPRKNQVSADHPQRIVVSKSGDMAYEYGRGSLSYDEQKTGKHVSFETGYLRVWKSVAGECKVAAFLVMPIESTMKEK
jgi:hypothetical protein